MEVKFLSNIQNINMYDTLSIVLSLIAVIVSIYAISSQNKGVVFEHRLSIYCKVSDMYDKSCRIVQGCSGKKNIGQKKLIAIILFDFKSDELELVNKIIEIQQSNNKIIVDKNHELMFDKYAEIFASKMDMSFRQESKLFYEKPIYDNIELLLREYDSIMLGFLALNEHEMNEYLDNLNKVLQKFSNDKTLEKMKNKLPI